MNRPSGPTAGGTAPRAPRSRYVVDASVAAKWFGDGECASAALSLLSAENDLHAPDFFMLEMDNLTCKWVRRRVLSAAEADRVRAALARIPLRLHPSAGLREAAWLLANQTGRTVYDCLYLALAVLLGAPMVTADRRLLNALASGPFGRQVLWVEQLP